MKVSFTMMLAIHGITMLSQVHLSVLLAVRHTWC